jgi:uncharacterized protein (TIGR02466 family)
MSQFLKNIFHVPLLIGKSDCKEVCDEVVTLAYKFRDSVVEGRLVSEEWNKGTKSSDMNDFLTKGVTSFNSVQDLHTNPEWDNVTRFIYDFAGTMIRSVSDGSLQPHIINMWTTIYPTGCFVPEHVHSNALLSGVFYAKAPEDCGDIVFSDPAWVTKTMFLHRPEPVFPGVCTKQGEIAEVGKMLLFPAWLPHKTLPNNSTEDRIIVSFNIGFSDVT